MQNTEWHDGDTLNFWIKMRYLKIMQSRSRTKGGILFGSAGMWLIIGTSSAIISRGGKQAVFLYCFFVLLAALCIWAGVYVKKQQRGMLKEIEDNHFQWKCDKVKEVLPDRYPKPNRILIYSEETPCYLLQAYFYFQKDVYVYVIKPETPEQGREIVAFLG